MKVFDGLKELAREHIRKRFRKFLPHARLTASNCDYLLRSSLR